MKFIRQTPTQRKPKVKEVTVKVQGIPRVTQQEQDDIDNWIAEHADHIKKLGVKTSAWFGLQWAECGDYMHVQCGCGATFVRHTYKDKPVCSIGDAAKLQTKNLGISQ